MPIASDLNRTVAGFYLKMFPTLSSEKIQLSIPYSYADGHTCYDFFLLIPDNGITIQLNNGNTSVRINQTYTKSSFLTGIRLSEESSFQYGQSGIKIENDHALVFNITDLGFHYRAVSSLYYDDIPIVVNYSHIPVHVQDGIEIISQISDYSNKNFLSELGIEHYRLTTKDGSWGNTANQYCKVALYGGTTTGVGIPLNYGDIILVRPLDPLPDSVQLEMGYYLYTHQLTTYGAQSNTDPIKIVDCSSAYPGVQWYRQVDSFGTIYLVLLLELLNKSTNSHIKILPYFYMVDVYILKNNTPVNQAFVEHNLKNSTSTSIFQYIDPIKTRGEIIQLLSYSTSQGQDPGMSFTLSNLKNHKDNFCLLHLSDTHCVNTRSLRHIMDFYNYYDYLINDIIHTGDSLSDKITDENFFDTYEPAHRILNVIGNHDAARRENNDLVYDNVSLSSVYNKIFVGRYPINPIYSSWGISLNEGKCYYNKTYPGKQLMLIVLDCMHWDSDQYQWMSQKLNEANTAHHRVICAIHSRPQRGLEKINCNFSGVSHDLSSVIRTDPALSVDDPYDLVDSFISAGGKFVCWLGGHAHFDYIGKVQSVNTTQLFVIIDNAGPMSEYGDCLKIRGSYGEDCFNLIGFDFENHFIKLLRIGRTLDRYMRSIHTLCVRYTDGTIIASS